MHAALLLLACSAPAPRPAPPLRSADLVGKWGQTWLGGSGAALYRPDGTCSYYWHGEHWEGTWRLRGNALTIVTWRATESPDASPLTYRYEIARTRRGIEGSPWKVERSSLR